MNVPTGHRILVIDDNELIHRDFRKILSGPVASDELDTLETELLGATNAGPPPSATVGGVYELHSAFQGEEGYELVRRSIQDDRRFALAFVDMRMPPGWDGLQTITEVCKIDPDIQIVLCTAYSDHSWDDLFKQFGSMDRLLILKKPFDLVEVCQLASALTQKWRLARAVGQKLAQLDTVVIDQTRELELRNARLLAEVEQRKRSETRYRLVEAGANDGLWDWDLLAHRIYYSVRWKQMLGFADGEITDGEHEWFSRLHADDLTRMHQDLHSHLRGHSAQLCGEYRFLHKSGHYLWILCRGIGVRDAQGLPVRAAGSFTDITDRKTAADRLLHEALHDPLTGLPNRTLFADRVDGCIALAKRTNFAFAVLFLDLDRFKIVNDSLGHAAGDALLNTIAARLAVAVQADESAALTPESTRLTVARMGGDEFTILLEHLRSPSDATRAADRVLAAIAAPVTYKDHQLTTTASIGIVIQGAGVGTEYETAKNLLRDADAAMYKAKSGGRDRYVVFDRAMHAEVLKRLTLESDLRRAIDRNELELHYQPIVSLADRKTVGAEALVRWRRNGVLVSPGEFIPVAEDTNLIIPIGTWVLRRACKQLAQWRAQGGGLADLYVTVNVSRRQLVDPAFITTVKNAIEESGVLPSAIGLEITESVAMSDPDAAESALVELKRQAGVRLLIDDFGTGYSSLGCLQRFPTDVLKVDQSFVKHVIGNDRNAAVMRTIVKLAHDLNIAVVAEGVESADQLAFLAEANCDLIQGYLFSRPLTAEAFANYLTVSESARLFPLPQGVAA